MFDTQFTLDSPSEAAINVYRCEAVGRARGIVLVFHGLAEHAGRYGAFARHLAGRGFVVYAHDHRGHGSTSAFDAPLRRFARRGGAAKVLLDCRAVHEVAGYEHHGLATVVFGHSMGGHIAAAYACRQTPALAGLAVWNAGRAGAASTLAGRAALAVERAAKGSDVASAVMRRATFDAWGRTVLGRRTMFDWLSHDAATVAAYMADPLCGWSPTVSMWQDVLALMAEAADERQLGLLPRELPVHLLGGTEDPATDGGEAVRALAGLLRHAGSRDVTLALIDGARHETLNEGEPARSQAIAAFDAWLDRLLP